MSSLDDPPRLPAALGGCIDEIGGSAKITGSTLTVILPTTRSETLDIPCLIRPLYFNVEMGPEFKGDVGGFRVPLGFSVYPDRGKAVDPPRYSRVAGFYGPAPLADPNRDFQSVRMTADFARTFIGERRILFRPSAASQATELTLVLRTEPAAGIGIVEGVPFTGHRFFSSFEVRFDYLPWSVRGTRIFWRVRAAGGRNPFYCFAATSGSLTSGDPIGRFQLTAKEGEGCDNAPFHLDIAPEHDGRGFFGHEPYSKTVSFELPPRRKLTRIAPLPR